VGAYLRALALTLTIEVPLYVAVLGPPGAALRGPALAWGRACRYGFVVNLVSHPLAFLVAYPLLRHLVGRTVSLILVEVGVIVLEAAMLRRWLRDEQVALIASALVNVVSLTVGMALLS
jgi:hypothetical protein